MQYHITFFLSSGYYYAVKATFIFFSDIGIQ